MISIADRCTIGLRKSFVFRATMSLRNSYNLKRPICKFDRDGYCRNGSKCNFSHARAEIGPQKTLRPIAANPVATVPWYDDWQCGTAGCRNNFPGKVFGSALECKECGKLNPARSFGINTTGGSSHPVATTQQVYQAPLANIEESSADTNGRPTRAMKKVAEHGNIAKSKNVVSMNSHTITFI